MRRGGVLQDADLDAQLRRVLLILAAVSLAGPGRAAVPSVAAPTQTFGSTPQQRENLRHCAAEWTRMKRTGEASGRLWRDFWVVCRKV